MDHTCTDSGSCGNTPTWATDIPSRDRRVLELAFGTEPAALCNVPALLVIDVVWGFTGSRPWPILDAVAEYPTSCGTYAWSALPHIRRCIDVFRRHTLPIVWLRPASDVSSGDGRATRRRRVGTLPGGLDPDEIHPNVAPSEGEIVIQKRRASAFFDTDLNTRLRGFGVDGTVIVGTTTSGCVRASAVDSLSYGYETFIVHDGCFDRSVSSHNCSLFDLSYKYATVLSASDLESQMVSRERR